MNLKLKFTLMLLSSMVISACNNNADKPENTQVSSNETKKIEINSLENTETANQEKSEINKFYANNYYEPPRNYFELRSIKFYLGKLQPGDNLNGENSKIYTNLVTLVSEAKGIRSITSTNPYIDVYTERNPVKQHDNAKQLLNDARELVKDVKDKDYIKLPLSSAKLPPPADTLVVRAILYVQNDGKQVSLANWETYNTFARRDTLGIDYVGSSVNFPISETQAADIIRNSPAEIGGYVYMSVSSNEYSPSEYKLDHVDLMVKGDGKNILEASKDISQE